MKRFLGIDAGLSGTKAAVLRADGVLLGRARVSVPEAEPNQLDPRALYDAVLAAGRAALADAAVEAVDAIAIGALGPCPVMLDAAGQPLGLSPVFSRDPRAEAIRLALRKTHGLKDSEFGPDHVLPKLAWVRKNAPKVFAKATFCVDLAGYLTGELTGKPAMDTITLGDHAAPGIEPLLPHPAPAEPQSIAGGLTSKAARVLGLPEGTPVATGCYDSFADILGAGCVDLGDAVMLIGSTLVIGQASDIDEVGEDLRLSPFIGSGNLISGWTSAAMSLIDWSAARTPPDAVGAAAQLPPGAGGLLMLPYFAGERAPQWDPLARGAVIGLTLATAPVQMHRAAIDAVALSALDLVERIDATAGARAQYRVTGGGARNAALVQAIADALGMPLALMAHAGEAVGPAALAALSQGERIVIPVERMVQPNGENAERFAHLLSLYRPLYASLKDTMHALHRYD